MQKKIQAILRAGFLAVVAMFCVLVLLSVWNIVSRLMFGNMVAKAAPINADISRLAEQFEENKKMIKIGYEMADDENKEDVVFGMLDMVENYSDEAAKVSMHMKSAAPHMQGRTIKAIKVRFEDSEVDRDSLEREYDRMYEEICSNISNIEKVSDRRKLNAILAYMAREFSYDQNYNKGQSNLLKSVTESKKIVCTGYSEIIDELCERMDIDCRIITNETHAWNYIRLDDADAYIQIDATEKYMPYLVTIKEFSYQPMDEVKLASMVDNCIFWIHSCPLAAFVSMAVLVCGVIEEIRRHIYFKRHFNKKNHIHT